jgi:hypothetical protein
MRLYFAFAVTAIILVTSPAIAQTGEMDEKNIYEGEFVRLTVPEGWNASEVREEVYSLYSSFDDELLGYPVEVTPNDDTAGLMISVTGRDDVDASLFDWIVLSRGSGVEIYELFVNEIEVEDTKGNRHDARLTINALDSGSSTVVMCHDLIMFIGDSRYEFTFLAGVDEYGPKFSGFEEIMASVEFK